MRNRHNEWRPQSAEVIIGKDILELLSSSMYVDPMTIYREYVQNAADSIDEARRSGLLSPKVAGRIDVTLDPATRSIRIRDNATGVKWSEFDTRLTAFGASTKRGTNARGFRGVGRLAGIGYCRELIFRSRACGEAQISEIKWDCRRLKSALRSIEFAGDLAKLVGEVVSIRRVKDDNAADHFFEVELNGVVRHRNDRLLSATAVSEYLSQVAPVPFSPDFQFVPKILQALTPHVAMGNIEIRIGNTETSLFRPHRDILEVKKNVYDAFTEVEVLKIPGVEGGIAAIAWVLHSGYTGAIPLKSLMRGLRLRSGNIQIGDHSLLEELFPEPRFNAWSVGEIHIIDTRIVPNGRRDHFEQSVHFDNLLNHLGPVAREIARRCRTSSIKRQRLRQFKMLETATREKLSIIAQGSLGRRQRRQLARDIEILLATMEKIVEMEVFASDADCAPRKIIRRLRQKLARLTERGPAAVALSRLPPAKRAMYEHVFGLIYECATNRLAAKALVDRILVKLR